MGDAHFKHKAEKAMKERITSDQTVVFVSHVEKQIEDLCDRALWINDARVQSHGNTPEVLEKYRDYVNTLDARN